MHTWPPVSILSPPNAISKGQIQHIDFTNNVPATLYSAKQKGIPLLIVP